MAELTELQLLLDRLSKNVHGSTSLKAKTRAEFRVILEEAIRVVCRSEIQENPPPGQPSGLLADPQTTGIVLSWDGPAPEPDFLEWRVYRATNEGGPYTHLSDRVVPDYTDTTAVAGTQYWYRVTAVDDVGGESVPAVVTAIRPAADATAPAAPVNVTATPVGINDVLIDWDPNSEPDLAGYNVYRSEVSGSGYVKLNVGLLTASEYRDTTTVAATTYYYVVTAEDANGNESVDSVEVEYEVDAVDITPPATPTGLVLIPSTSGILLSWTANTESDFDEYEVERSPDGVGTWTSLATPSVATYNDTTATAGVVSYYRISALDDDANRSGYLTGNATRPTGSTPGESWNPTHIGRMVPCVAHFRLVNKTKWSTSTGLTTVLSSEFPSFASQDPLLTQYEFNFASGSGQPQGDYPQLRGFNAAHIYDVAGTYTMTGTVTPPNRGTPTNYAATRTFSADTRTPIYITPNGSGTGNGNTEASPVSPSRAQQIQNAATSPVKLLFKRGERFTHSGNNPFIEVTKNDTLLSAYGAGERPMFVYSGPGTDFRAFFRVRSAVQNAFFENMQFDQSYSGEGHEGFIAFQGAINFCARNLTFFKADRCFDPGNSGMEGVLIQNCDAPVDGSRRDNFTGLAKGADWVLLGLNVANTMEEHPLRVSEMDRLLIHDCKFREGKMNASDDYGSAFRLQAGNFYYVRKTHLEHFGGGHADLGPLDQCTGQQKARTQYVVLEQNEFECTVRLCPGLAHVIFRNNIWDWENESLIDGIGYYYNHPTCSPTLKFEKGTKDIRFYNNTWVLNAGGGLGFLYLRSQEAEKGEDGIPAVTGPIVLKNNNFVAGSGVSSSSANVRFLTSTLQDDGIESDRNVWSSSLRFRKDNSYIDLAAWNAIDGVGQDDHEDVGFAQDYIPAIGSKARTFARPLQGVWEDYNGTSRQLSDSTWSAGAIAV